MPATNRDLVPFGTAVRTWAAIRLQSFGGPAGQIAVMQRTLVDEKRWIGQRRFLHALNFCMLLPGPEAQQLSWAFLRLDVPVWSSVSWTGVRHRCRGFRVRALGALVGVEALGACAALGLLAALPTWV
jgi:hypothetical protein